MGLGFGVSVLSFLEPEISSKCLHRLTARFFINLRAIAFHQRVSTFETHALSFEPPTIRTRPLHKQSDRISTSNFVHLEMEKTVYSSRTNDENTVHADIIDLEAIDPQTHQKPG
jgi:hypothetical protein